MIDIRVKSSGVILDIAPDAEFQIEFDNPMFEDDRCPVAFSTEINFLPTQNNKEQLRYLDAMFLPPAVKRLDVEIYASGMKILDGMIKFSSVKDGIINYTFSGRSLDDDWSGKIYEKEIFQMSGDEETQQSQIGSILVGNVDGVSAPLLVNASETDKVAAMQDLTLSGMNDCPTEIKYHNYPVKPSHVIPGVLYKYHVLTPAIRVTKILASELGNVDVPNNLTQVLADISILGQYKTDFAQTASGIPSTGLDLGRALPDVTSLELFRVLLKMYCCALFRDGSRFSMRNLGEILGDSVALNWDEKIARDAEVETLASGGYKFEYGNGTDESFNTNESFETVNSFIVMYDRLEVGSETYLVFKHSFSGQMVSARRSKGITSTSSSHSSGTQQAVFFPEMLLCDSLSDELISYDFQPAESDGDVFDGSVNAKLSRCVPDRLSDAPNISGGGSRWRMASIINPESIGDKRGSDVIIGRVAGGRFEQQLTDGLVWFEGDEEVHQTSLLKSLRPKDLYLCYHESFSRWCGAPHQVVKSDLYLNMEDIASLRMWQKIAFAGRTWLVRKLTVTFHAGSGRLDSSGEFVSVN